MKLNKEEHLLKEYAEEIHYNVENVQTAKLANTVRRGVAQGRKREMRRRFTYSAAFVTFAAMAGIIIFILGGWPGVKEEVKLVQTSSADSVTDFELFRPVSAYDLGFQAALEQKLLKPVKQGVEKDGYRVDVAGAVTDGRRAYILFTLQNHTNHNAWPIVTSLKFGDVEAPSFKAQAKNTLNGGHLGPGDSGYFVYSTNLDVNTHYNKNAVISIDALDTTSQKTTKGLDISFDLDTTMLNSKENIFVPERPLSIDEQNINVSRVQFTPLGTYVDLEYDSGNEKQIFKVLNPVLIGSTNQHNEKLFYPEETLKNDQSTTLFYKNSTINQMDTLSLKVFGIIAVSKDQLKVVIDLNKREIKSAPDDKLQILTHDENTAPGELNFYRRLEQAQIPSFGIFGMSLSDTFTDANGKKHKMERTNKINQWGQSLSYSAKTDVLEEHNFYNFGEEALSYPQPLTIPVKQYWLPVVETQSVEIKSEK